MSRRVLATIAGPLAIVALLSGCGGGAAPGKAELIEQGDGICMDAGVDLGRRIHNYEHEVGLAHRITGPTPKQEERLIAEVILPRFRALAEELGELSPPEGEEAEFEEIVEGLEEGAEEAETNPSILRSDSNPFVDVKALAADFGFEVCGES